MTDPRQHSPSMASRSAAYSCLSSSWLFFFWVGFLLAAGFASAFLPAAPSCFPPVAAFLFLGSLLAFSLIGEWKRTKLISTTLKHDTHMLKFAKVCILNPSVDRWFFCLSFCSFVDSFVLSVVFRTFVFSLFAFSFVLPFVRYSFVRSFVRSFIRSSFRSFIRPSVRYSVHCFPFICLSIPTIVRLLNSLYLFCYNLCKCDFTHLFFLFLARCGYTKESKSYRRNSKSHAQHTTRWNEVKYSKLWSSTFFQFGKNQFFHVVTELCLSIFDEIFGGELFVRSYDIC